MRAVTTFILIICLFWQSMSYAGAGISLVQDVEAAHELLHFTGDAHHHHDGDGEGFHQDDSVASVKHAMADAHAFAPALLTAAALPLLTICSDPPAGAHATEPPLPFLSGPERPPKALT
jgi:hypothetical protein